MALVVVGIALVSLVGWRLVPARAERRSLDRYGKAMRTLRAKSDRTQRESPSCRADRLRLVELSGAGEATPFDWSDTDESVVGDDANREVHHHQDGNRLRWLSLGEDVQIGIMRRAASGVVPPALFERII